MTDPAAKARELREVDGLKVAFVRHEDYFDSLMSPSMGSVRRDPGADVVMLLGPGKTGDDLSDDYIRGVLGLAAQSREARQALGGGRE